ncbi:hypothetical protein [Streptomyces sp. e14]|uniref:hypothetical protein n=1 Tax=Streptomyces sp. e14 TaxID=645465 RepID=UPI001E439B10|nr:hypothetical protein [Streptomyces sp. e14]
MPDLAGPERRPGEADDDEQAGEQGERDDGQGVREGAPPRVHDQRAEVPVGVVAAGAQHGPVGADEHGEAEQHGAGLGGPVGVLEGGEVGHALLAGQLVPAGVPGERLPEHGGRVHDEEDEDDDLLEQFARLEQGEGEDRPGARAAGGRGRGHGLGRGGDGRGHRAFTCAPVSSRVSR